LFFKGAAAVVFQGKCHSRTSYSLEAAVLQQECVCCSPQKTEALSVPVLCGNGTQSLHTVQSVTECDCVSKHCT
jgi:integrin beta 3